MDTGELLVLNVPEWYKREDFGAWLHRPDVRPVATWDRGIIGHDLGEYSDAFMTFDWHDGTWEGSDDDLPKDIFEQVNEALIEQGLTSGVIWLKNLEGNSDVPHLAEIVDRIQKRCNACGVQDAILNKCERCERPFCYDCYHDHRCLVRD